MSSPSAPDLIVVGAGIVGLAHALAAVRLGKHVLVIDRDQQANGASIRNFGFVTVTGQERGPVWNLARRSAEVWREIAEPAGIAIEQRGLLTVAQRPAAEAVLQAFLATEMGEGCEWLTADQMPGIQCIGALHSPHDVRVESRTAVPKLAAWLEQVHGVPFLRGTAVQGVEGGRVTCTRGTYRAEVVIVCPGDDMASLFPDSFRQRRVTRCALQMMRLADPGWRLPHPIMSDLSLIRYLGYARLPEARALEAQLRVEQAAKVEHGIHLIVVQSADGSLVVGDSHHYADIPPPFAQAEVERLILDEFAALFGPPPPVIERWTGTYASADRHSMVETPANGVRLVVVTSGTGASTAFALAEQVVGDLFGK